MVYRRDGPDDHDHTESDDEFGDGNALEVPEESGTSETLEIGDDFEVIESEEEFERRLESEYPGPSAYDIALSERDDDDSGKNRFTGDWLKSAGGGLLIFAALGVLISLVGPLAFSRGSNTVDETFRSVRVEEVVDGNTIVVTLDGDRETVRYIGIAVGVPGESYYRTSQLANQSWVEGEIVILERDGDDRDKDGRLLRYVYVENQMVNAVLLASGLARYSPHHSNNRHDSTLLSAENAARDAQRGIWAGDDVAEVRPA